MAVDFSVYKRGERKFYQVAFRDPRTGKILPAISSKKTSRAAAILWAQKKYKEMVLASEGQAKPSMTLREWAEPFFGPKCPYIGRRKDEGKSYSSNYIRNCRSYLVKYILPSPIVDISIEGLRRRHVLEWRRRLLEEHGGSRTTERALATLKIILSEAVYQELIEYSPASRVVAPAYDKKVRTALPLARVKALLSPGLYEDPRHWMATVLTAYTGMRASEVRALQWDDVDFEAKVIRVRHAFKDQTKVLGPPKSGKARTTPLSPLLERMLKEWRKRIPADPGVNAHGDARKVGTGPWVFGYSVARPLGYKAWNLAVKSAAVKAGCPGATLHYLRHTLNTHLRGEVDDIKLRESFGWAGPAVQDGYTHGEAMDYSDQGLAIDRLLGGA